MGIQEAIEELREAIRRERELPTRVRWQALIDRGAIDEKGRVLIRGPEPKPKKKARKS